MVRLTKEALLSAEKKRSTARPNNNHYVPPKKKTVQRGGIKKVGNKRYPRAENADKDRVCFNDDDGKKIRFKAAYSPAFCAKNKNKGPPSRTYGASKR
jgi:hypothetical protein